MSQKVMSASLRRAPADAGHVLANDPQPEVLMGLLVVADQPPDHEVQKVEALRVPLKTRHDHPSSFFHRLFQEPHWLNLLVWSWDSIKASPRFEL